MTVVAIVGTGVVGARVARQLLAIRPEVRLVVHDTDVDRLRGVVRTLGPTVSMAAGGDLLRARPDVVVIATAAGRHLAHARRAVRAGIAVVSTSDRLDEVRSLLGMDALAVSKGSTMLVGAAFSPGMTGLLAAHGARWFDEVDEIHVAKAGTGGPACARQHHRALSGSAIDWRSGRWRRRPGGSGRELVWFPEPLGGADCYRGALADAILLQPAFPGADRITARIAATRQDRFTSWLPMLSPPHAEGGVGGIRVELRGRRGGRRLVEVAGAVERPGTAAAAVATVAVECILDGVAGGTGARGLAELSDPAAALAVLARRGLRAQRFEGLAE